jgi:hypothetical protein
MSIMERMERADAQRVLDQGGQLVLVHIPKTAGTTLRLLLEGRFRPEEINSRYDRVWNTDLAGYRFVSGHYFLDFLRRLLPGNPVFITFLRDPIERTLSDYAQMQNAPDRRGHPFGVEQDLEAYLFHPWASVGSTDLQTRYLGAVLDWDGAEGPQRAMSRDTHRAELGKHARASDALRELERMPFFGITERFHDSLALLAYTLGWPPFESDLVENVSIARPRRHNLPAHLIDRLMELNQQDLVLYHEAQKLFDERMAQMHSELLGR